MNRTQNMIYTNQLKDIVSKAKADNIGCLLFSLYSVKLLIHCRIMRLKGDFL